MVRLDEKNWVKAGLERSPERAGLEVGFSGFQVGPPLGKDLHDLS